MKSDYLIIHKSVLPEHFEKVLLCKHLLRDGTARDIGEAAKTAGISRSTYYKYRDCVFEPSAGDGVRKAVFSMLLSHEKGTLNRVLSVFSASDANVITIMQNPPIAGRASVIISVDISSITDSADTITKHLQAVEGVEKAGLLDIE